MHSTKKNIIETAFELFREKGYSNVTVNDICDATSITKTTFYYHLKSKEDIVSEFYQTVSESLSENMLEILSTHNPLEQLMVLFDILIERSEKIGPDLNSQLMIINLTKDRNTFDFDKKIEELGVMLIKKAQKNGQINNQSPALLLFQAVCHASVGYELQWCIKKGTIDRKKLFRQAMENMLDVPPEHRGENAYENYITYIK